VFDSLERTPLFERTNVLGNIIVSGGLFKLKNFKERLSASIQDKYRDFVKNSTYDLNVKILDSKDTEDFNLYSLKGLNTFWEQFQGFSDLLVTKQEWREKGFIED